MKKPTLEKTQGKTQKTQKNPGFLGFFKILGFCPTLERERERNTHGRVITSICAFCRFWPELLTPPSSAKRDWSKKSYDNPFRGDSRVTAFQNFAVDKSVWKPESPIANCFLGKPDHPWSIWSQKRTRMFLHLNTGSPLDLCLVSNVYIGLN